MQNLFLGLAARKKKVYLSTDKNPLHLAITKQKKQHKEIINTKFPPASKEWVNSIYSFNPNYIKPLAMVDIMVNRLVKSYFNFVKLLWKKNYKFNAINLKKKYKLIKRRKRAERKKNKLSLNKVFVSKGEIKHTNNKVIVTFYIFNKTKNFLMYNLKKLYKTFSVLKLNNTITQENKQVNKGLVSHLGKKSLTGKNMKNNFSSYINKKRNKNIANKDLRVNSLQLFGLNKKAEKGLNITHLNSAEKIKPNLYDHIYLAYLTKKRISRFISKINNTDIKNKYITLMKDFYSSISKYKLYSKQSSLNYTNTRENVMYNINTLNISSNIFNINNARLSVFYKILNRNHNFNLSRFTKYFERMQKTCLDINTKSNIVNKMSAISLKTKKAENPLNIVHILKTFYKSFALYNNNVDFALQNKPVNTLNISKPFNIVNKQSYLFNILKKYKHETSSPISSLVEKNTNKMKIMVLKTIKLINKIRRYKKFIKKSLILELNTIDHNNMNKRFHTYEKNCIRYFLIKTYRKEFLYIRYVKMLLFNNNKYRNTFLLGLKNVVSKLYNKKVEFNFVNLKYMYLNSDILSRSIVTRLRNRRNRLLTVLNKALLLVNIPSLNYKGGFTPFPLGKTTIEKNQQNISLFVPHTHNNNDILSQLLKKLHLANKPSTIKSKSLSSTQENALQLLNNKAVFGVRLQAGGRLTKRLTASRSVSKLKYRGSIKNINSSIYGLSSVILKGNLRSNLQYTNITSKTRNGSFGLKGWVSAY